MQLLLTFTLALTELRFRARLPLFLILCCVVDTRCCIASLPGNYEEHLPEWQIIIIPLPVAERLMEEATMTEMIKSQKVSWREEAYLAPFHSAWLSSFIGMPAGNTSVPSKLPPPHRHAAVTTCTAVLFSFIGSCVKLANLSMTCHGLFSLVNSFLHLCRENTANYSANIKKLLLPFAHLPNSPLFRRQPEIRRRRGTKVVVPVHRT